MDFHKRNKKINDIKHYYHNKKTPSKYSVGERHPDAFAPFNNNIANHLVHIYISLVSIDNVLYAIKIIFWKSMLEDMYQLITIFNNCF
jgi:hypothetical protein